MGKSSKQDVVGRWEGEEGPERRGNQDKGSVEKPCEGIERWLSS